MHHMIFLNKKNKIISVDFYQAYLNQNADLNKLFVVFKVQKNITYIDIKGYRRFSNSHKLVSRWLMEKKIGRRLKKDEVVHHINGNKLDNNISNLFIFKNQADHHRFHINTLQKTGSWC